MHFRARALALVLPGLLGAILSAASLETYAQDTPRTIEVHAKRGSFDRSDITLQMGERVKFLLTSDDVTHELVIPDLHVAQEIKKGHPVELTIVADKVGDFAGKCGHFCEIGHGSMTFTVHVKSN